jgi:hypothetical protein
MTMSETFRYSRMFEAPDRHSPDPVRMTVDTTFETTADPQSTRAITQVELITKSTRANVWNC